MHPQLTLIVARQRIADLHRAADHNRLVHAATSPASPAPRHAAAAPVTLIRQLRRRLAQTHLAAR
jgi:hypothetical protein